MVRGPELASSPSIRDILLINPNTSTSTTEMMVRIASDGLPAGFRVRGATVDAGPSMIVDERELDAAAAEVERTWRAVGGDCAGVIVGAFGDPGLAQVRAASRVPAVGLCEAAMREASQGGRRFGIATVTPSLVVPIDARADALGLRAVYTGIRLTEGDPRALAAAPQALEEALARAVRRCIDEDGAQAVIIGGGPLGQAAIGLAERFEVPVIAPISSAVRWLLARIAPAQTPHAGHLPTD